MLDPILAVAVAAAVMTLFSLVVARLVPDDYDLELSKVETRRR